MKVLAVVLAALPLVGEVSARDHHARSAFVRTHPCPANGHTRGACPGWHVDHIIPLKCNGADSPINMQWLTVSAHKAKTKAEAKDCRRPRKQPIQ